MEEWTMNLNIKSAEAHEMAVQLARQTGDSITGAVTKAIRAQLHRTSNMDERIARIDAITKRTAAALRDSPGSADIDALLYDELGLPK
jgi:antitoxin VapB